MFPRYNGTMAQLHTHPHARTRTEPYPAHTAALRALDRIVFVAGVIGPLMTLPQLVEIYASHNASGVSPLTWGAYALLDIPWILYGLSHREGPITITYTLWFIFNTLVLVGVLLYG